MLPQRIRTTKGEGKVKRRFPAHCNFVRNHACCACGSKAAIEVAHVRTGTDGGMGKKPGDWWTISLCHECHSRQHQVGEASFENETGIDMKELATEFAAKSPKAREMRDARNG